jgi:hypothetical protein
MKAPVAMPDMYVGLQSFELLRVDYVAPEASGRVGGVQAGFPLWQANWSFSRMPQSNSDEWRAWLSGMRGQTRRFIGRDLARPLPRAYMETGLPGGFGGAASSWSSTINADGDCELTLNGLPAGFQISQGDYTDFRYDATEEAIEDLPWRALVRSTENVVADGSGVATFIVEPPVPSAVPLDAVAHLDEPGCIMALVLDQTSLEPVDRLYAVLGGTIAALQDLRS